MKSQPILIAVILGLLALAGSQIGAVPLGTAFTYQGSLSAGTQPANGLYDFRFAIWDASANGNPIGGPLTNNAVSVTNGLFTVALDFGGGAFAGDARWLDIGVCTNGGGTFHTLTPRQPLTPAPYALYAPMAAVATTASSVANNAVYGSGIASHQVVKSLNGLQDAVTLAPGANVTLTTNANTLTLAAAGGGTTGGWSTMGNAGTSPGTSFLGTTDNTPLEIRVNGLRAGLLVPAGGAPSVILGAAANSIASDSPGSSILGGTNNAIQANAGYSLIGGGYNNQIQTNATYSTIGGGWQNQIQTNAWGSTIGGGEQNQIQTNGFGSVIAGGMLNQILANPYLPGYDYRTIAGGYNNLLEGQSPGAAIGGGDANRVQSGAEAAVISGGNDNTIGTNAQLGVIGGGYQNWIQNDAFNSVIGGGFQNQIQNDAYLSVIGGGEQNQIQISARWAAVGGGRMNQIQSNAFYSVIGGGAGNLIQTNAVNATIGGGYANVVSGAYGAVPGGDGNSASAHSFAAGHRAKAHAAGTFVWADSNDFDFDPWLENGQQGSLNSFNVRATGGFYIVTGINPADGHILNGATLASGSGSWGSYSDRNAKANCRPVDPRIVLAQVAALPIATWNYKTQDPSIRHLGPMAQDFHAAFGVGDSDKTITTVDADGVALAAIQGLNQKLEDGSQRAEVRSQRSEVRIQKLEAENAELKERLAQLEQLVNMVTQQPKGDER